MTLYQSFEKVLQSLGMHAVTHPVFYSTPIGIRFDIGNSAEIDVYLDRSAEKLEVNPSYVNFCLQRAKAVYDELPLAPDILVIRGDPYDAETEEGFTKRITAAAKLPHPDEIRTESHSEDGETFTRVYLFWTLSDFTPDTLLREIIMADLGGFQALSSSVYFVNTLNNTLFHLYDDRGADLVAAGKSALLDIYRNLNHLILDYDRDRIDTVFCE